MNKQIQLRGNCQCCGRLQAVVKGYVAKHGYEVQSRGMGGWFSGVCPGHNHAPMQTERVVTDATVAGILAQVKEVRCRADEYESGARVPEMVQTGRWDAATRQYKTVPWAEASEYDREAQVKKEVYGRRQRANAGEQVAQQLKALADAVHGTELVEVKKADAPVVIQVGERRLSQGRGVIKALDVYRGMVTWQDERGFKSRMSTRSWRLLAMAE